MNDIQETTLCINLAKSLKNIAYLKSKTTTNTKFMAVVKAYGYGSASQEIAYYLQEKKQVDYFAVAYGYEGANLRKAGVTLPILVLHPLQAHFKTILEHNLEPAIYSLELLQNFIKALADATNTEIAIQLKFNTGLNRLGFSKEDIPAIKNLLKDTTIKVHGIFSHLAASEDMAEKEFTLEQIKRFDQIWDAFFKAMPKQKPLRHILNTSGILNYANIASLDMVRSGIGIYGYGDANLTPITSLKSVISQIHPIAKAESIGYNRSHIADKDMISATIALGHADGIARIYAKKKGFVYINQQKAPIIANICMDMLMVDVTDIPCKTGDTVVIFDATHSAEELSKHAGTIVYELLTSVSQRVKRTFKR